MFDTWTYGARYDLEFAGTTRFVIETRFIFASKTPPPPEPKYSIQIAIKTIVRNLGTRPREGLVRRLCLAVVDVQSPFPLRADLMQCTYPSPNAIGLFVDLREEKSKSRQFSRDTSRSDAADVGESYHR